MKHKLLTFLVGSAIVTSVAFAQEKKITGRIISATGEAVANATVIVQGSKTATISDKNGYYSISAPSEGKLIIRSIGFEEKILTIGENLSYNITLNTLNSNVDEVVIIGYGTGSTLGTTVGSAVRVGSEDIKGKPTANALEALSGKVPGLQVFTSSGEPSATQSIRLDGVGSLGASSTPLLVLDGIPVGIGSIVSMNPEDFENITVLKDASSTSIYGSRAANGVIYFTTKKGRIGERAIITTRVQYGWNDLASRKPARSFMNSSELLNFWVETGYRTQAQADSIRQRFPHDTKWDEFYYRKNVPMKQADLNISGGSEKTQYYLSVGYLDQEGVMFRSGFDRITLRANINSKLNKWISVGLNLGGGYDRRETNGWGSNNGNGGLSLFAPPFYSPYNEDGEEYYDETIPGLGRYNPRYLADKQPSKGKNQ